MELARTVALIVAAGGATGAVLSLGGVVSRRLDIATHLAPLWLLCGIFALVLLAVAGLPGVQPTLGLAVFAILVGFGMIAPELLTRVRFQSASPATQTLKVIQFNIWDRNRDPLAAARWIVAEDADIVVLEEAGERGGPIFDALTGLYPYRTTCPGLEHCPTSILSKSPPTAGGMITPPGMEARHAAAWATFGFGASAFSVAGVHYHWPEPIGAQDRQARLFADLIDRFDSDTLVVAGDFNLTPWSFTLKRQDARFGLSRRTRCLASWPAGSVARWGVKLAFPFLPIDHIYAGKAWRTVSVRRGPALGSDHLPIVAVLTRRIEP